MSTPAAAASAAVSTLMPPSISISQARPRASISLPHRRHLVEHLGDERLTAPPGVHAHHQQEVDLVEVRHHRVDRRRRVEHEADADVARAQLVEQRARVAELDVHDAAVGAGVGEVGEQHARVVDHEVTVEEQVGVLRAAHSRPAARW